MKPVIASAAVLGLCAAAGATPPRVVSTYYQPAYYQPVLAAQYVAVPYAVPYSVGLNQQADPAILERIAAAQERQAAALEKLASRGSNGEITDLPPEPEYVGLIRQNCASCHGLVPKGNKLTFFDSGGRFKEMAPDVLGNVIQQVASGAMPKDRKMLPEDRLKLITGLTTAPEQLKSPAKMPGAK